MAFKLNSQVVAGETLVGDVGGTSLVYDVRESSSLKGFLVITTEHGTMYADPEMTVEVLP